MLCMESEEECLSVFRDPSDVKHFGGQVATPTDTADTNQCTHKLTEIDLSGLMNYMSVGSLIVVQLSLS